eukprot:GHVS01086615.1.p1 GENE.GHVS01086615.1~~GHVS01086615.1.p1  ORF type:complete len:372 (+),score=54.74 GHVS01086615.1:143-1258(+)
MAFDMREERVKPFTAPSLSMSTGAPDTPCNIRDQLAGNNLLDDGECSVIHSPSSASSWWSEPYVQRSERCEFSLFSNGQRGGGQAQPSVWSIFSGSPIWATNALDAKTSAPLVVDPVEREVWRVEPSDSVHAQRLQLRGAEVRDFLLSVARQVEVNEALARLRTAEAIRHVLRYLNYPVHTHPSQVLRDRMVSGEMHPTQAVGGPNFSAPSVLAHPAEFKNPSSFLKIYGDPMCANGMGAKTPLRGAHGNWVCTKCDCVNFPRRFRCNKCETYRDARGDEVVSSYARFVYEQHLRTYQAIGAKAKPVSEVPPECHAQANRKKNISPFATFRRQERYPEDIAHREMVSSYPAGERMTVSGLSGFTPTHLSNG